MNAQVTVYGAEGCATTCTALRLAGIRFEAVDVHTSVLVDEPRSRAIRELPLVATSTGENWTGLRLDKIVELRPACAEEAHASEPSGEPLGLRDRLS